MHKQDNVLSVCLPLNDAVSFDLQQLCAASSSESLPCFQKGLIGSEIRERDCGVPKSEQ